MLDKSLRLLFSSQEFPLRFDRAEWILTIRTFAVFFGKFNNILG